jgi:hypothetical protein
MRVMWVPPEEGSTVYRVWQRDVGDSVAEAERRMIRQFSWTPLAEREDHLRDIQIIRQLGPRLEGYLDLTDNEPYVRITPMERLRYATLTIAAIASYATGAYHWQRRPSESRSKASQNSQPDSRKAQTLALPP